MRIPSLMVVLVAALAVAGCETKIDDSKVEKTISTSIADQVGAKVDSVDCPKDITAKKGGTFTCDVSGADGSTGNAVVKMTDADGRFEVSARFIHVRDLEKRIVNNLAQQVSADAADISITCPEIIVGKKGDTFRCEGTGEGEPIKLDVTQTDAGGHVHFEVVG
jgi:hypothetical protein